ncbi:hypothetical protein niasHT_038849 [Heterodera trifolii]|uniref:BACK domain-containing protein n=1 Tax=Heterodera trifolii TaxID=157864 RepID=A0ABD2J1A8_9BILA
MFRSNEQNSKNSIGKAHATKKTQIEDPDIEIDAFKAMLTFIYTMSFNGLDANNWLDVLKAADKYNITGLVKKCADFPIEKLPNVFVAFEQARLRNLEDFALRCLRYIDQNALIKSEAFLQIDQSLLCVILEKDELRSSEIEIWNAALNWADEQCRQNGFECSAENRRKMLGLALFNIRFPLIPKEDFTKSVDGNWSRKCSATLRIVSQKSDVEDLKKELDETVFNNEYPNWGFAFIDFAELMDPSKGLYNKDDDKVTLAIDFTLEELLGIYQFNSHPYIYLRGVPGLYSLKFPSHGRIFNWNKPKATEGGHLRWKLKKCRNLRERLSRVDDAKLMDPNNGFYNREEDKVTLAIDVTVKEEKMEKF